MMDQGGKIEQHARPETRSLVSAQLAEIYTPDAPIFDPSLFSGRQRLLMKCSRLLATRGATLVLYGERGVGKSSFCNVLLNGTSVLRRNASAGTTLDALFASMLAEVQQELTVSERNVKGNAGVSGPITVGGEISEKRIPLVPEVIDVNLLAKRLGAADLGLDAIVIDEVQEIEDPAGRLMLAALAKAWADAAVSPLLVLIGVGRGARELLGAEVERYGGRHIHAEAVLPLPSPDARDIIGRRERLGVNVTDDAAQVVVDVARGQPWRVQRVMLDSVYAWWDRQPSEVKPLETRRFRWFGKRLTPVVNLEALNVIVDRRDVEHALGELEDSGHTWAEGRKSSIHPLGESNPPSLRDLLEQYRANADRWTHRLHVYPPGEYRDALEMEPLRESDDQQHPDEGV